MKETLKVVVMLAGAAFVVLLAISPYLLALAGVIAVIWWVVFA